MMHIQIYDIIDFIYHHNKNLSINISTNRVPRKMPLNIKIYLMPKFTFKNITFCRLPFAHGKY